VTALDSLLVTEKETSGDHLDHNKFLRNGGRGMSAEQVEIVEEAFRLHIKKPKSVLNYFIAHRNPTTGAFILHLIMTLVIKLNLFYTLPPFFCQRPLNIRSRFK
jgi:hypothetical protein